MTNKLYLTIITLTISLLPISAGNRMSLDDVIHAARHQSVKALEARQAFISTYWAYRSYKASRLPSVYLRGNIMSFDRSLNLLQNPDDGSLKYVSSNNLQNDLSLTVNQNITFTGGTLSISSDLSRIAISKNSNEEIFVPFYTTKPDGTGIGLSLSRQIMHLHNGSLTLTRSDEKLTVFTLTFR